jgi:hypothetical protein
MGTGGPFPAAKVRPENDADHSPPSTAEVKNWVGALPLSPCASKAVLWDYFSLCCFIRRTASIIRAMMGPDDVVHTSETSVHFNVTTRRLHPWRLLNFKFLQFVKTAVNDNMTPLAERRERHVHKPFHYVCCRFVLNFNFASIFWGKKKNLFFSAWLS